MSTIELSPKWSIKVGPRGYDYELIERYDTINVKTKEPTVGSRSSYFPSLQQCVGELMKQGTLESIEAADSLKEVVEMLEKAETNILRSL